MEKIACLHCGLPNPRGSDFCCSGCKVIYELIHTHELTKNIISKFAPLKDDCKDQISGLENRVIKLDLKTNQVSLYIEGITCRACLWLLEKIPDMDNRIYGARINGDTHVLDVNYSSEMPSIEVAKLLTRLGFKPHLADSDENRKISLKEDKVWLLRMGVAGASALASMHVALTLYGGWLEGMSASIVKILGIISFLVSLPALSFSAWPFYRNSYLSLKVKEFLTLDILVSLSILSGVSLSLYNIKKGVNEFYFDSLSMLVALLLLGRFLSYKIEKKHAQKLKRLLSLRFSSDSKYSLGEIVEIKSGAAIPFDGVLTSGETLVDESWLTGEAHPVLKTEGSKVYSGCVNLRASFWAKVTASGENTRAGRIQTLLKNTPKSKGEVFSKNAEKVLVSMVLLLGLYVAMTHRWDLLVALLVVTCPCAFGLANPSVLSVAMTQALEKGILIKGGKCFEILSEIDTVVFDKTGTLTQKNYTLVGEQWFSQEEGKNFYRKIISQMANTSAHPILKVFQNESLEKISGVEERWGQGLLYEKYRLGRADFSSSEALPDVQEGSSQVVFSMDKKPIAQFNLSTAEEKEAKSAVSELRKNYATYLISGDNKTSVKILGANLGFEEDHIYYEATPEDKLDLISKLSKSRRTLMVGDGINDILAFKKSLLAVSVGGAADIALEVSDIHLTNSDLSLIRKLFDSAKNVRRALFINVSWTFLYNVVGVYLVLKGVIGPVACAILMPASSLTVLLNSHMRRYI